MRLFVKKIIPLFFILTFVIQVNAQNSYNNPKSSIIEKKLFNMSFLNYYNNSDSTILNVLVQVPYDQIQFIKNDNSFLADYSVTVSVFEDDKETLVAEKLWNEKIETRDAEQTTSDKSSNLSFKSFILKPDDYFIRVAIEDKNTKKILVRTKEIEVKEFSDKLDISDIMLISKETTVGNNKKIIPNLTGEVLTNKIGIPIYFEINSASAGTVEIDYSILDKFDRALFHDSETKTISEGKTQVYYSASDTALTLGLYTLKIKVNKNDVGARAEVKSEFNSRWAGMPSSVRSLNLAVDQLVYLASRKELDYINNAPTREDKAKRFTEFWKKRDPNPADDSDNRAFDEYYRRVAYSNEHFSQYIDGWKTDRGMVYIVLGAPDDVEHHPFERDSKPYEVWNYYNLEAQFGFLDNTGFGDYRLMNPGDFEIVRSRTGHY
ncbi:MAG TPA: GWxTD domain-containing protein [Ignavibacteriaceae bacterium]|nr:GWxTD domain-containing protein [Ignavibacteriaceae bacterium]